MTDSASQTRREQEWLLQEEWALRSLENCNRLISCRQCGEKETCFVQRMLPVLHFIRCEAYDGKLIVKFDEIHAKVGGDPQSLTHILERLIKHQEIRRFFGTFAINVPKTAAEFLLRFDDRNRTNEERILRSFEKPNCSFPCNSCDEKGACMVQKMLPVFHFISFQDHVVSMETRRKTGKDISDSDGRLGASFEEILAEVKGESESLKDILARLMAYGALRQLENERYTEIGIGN